ncbi:MAG TPA: hypothetical protein VHZ78_03355 [Rhizomicrobium sp.]|jgi:uncharacterized membrane protein YgcG|nr:hypothetical protein [Rhizomicrobium sp.]
MTKLRKVLARAALAAAVIGGTAAVTASPASARVVCNRYHCWHVYSGYYPYADPYNDPYYYPSYYGPGYYGPGVSFGINIGGGHHWHGGGGFHGGGGHFGGHHH